MHGRFLAGLLLLGTVGCNGMHKGGRGAAPGAVAVDDDGIPVGTSPQERERLLKSRVCTMELTVGSHIPERVCRFTSDEPTTPIDDLMRPAQQSWGPKSGG